MALISFWLDQVSQLCAICQYLLSVMFSFKYSVIVEIYTLFLVFMFLSQVLLFLIILCLGYLFVASIKSFSNIIFFCPIFLYLSNLTVLKLTDSCKSFRCDFFLIWLVCAVLMKSVISFF